MEILIVVAIFGILASVILSNIGKRAKEKATDAKEITQLELLSTALQVYYFDHGEYPYDTTKGPHPNSACFLDGGTLCLECTTSDTPFFMAHLQAEGYITEEAIVNMFAGGESLPFGACYHYTEDLQQFKIVAKLYNDTPEENDGGISSNHYEVGPNLDLPVYTLTPNLYD